MKKAVLFDLDGTLWHTCDVILPVWNDILKKHKKTTKQITLEEMNSYMGKTVEQIASIMLPELPLENSVAIVKECCAEQIPSLRKTGGHLYDNLESTLGILSENYFLGIISNCQCGYIEAFLFAHGQRGPEGQRPGGAEDPAAVPGWECHPAHQAVQRLRRRRRIRGRG